MTSRRVDNQPLRELLGAAGWTYEALARAVNALGAENGVRLRYDRTAVAHWLAGSLPRPRSRQLIAEAFTRRLRRPVTQTDLGMADSGCALGDSPYGGAEAGRRAVPSLTALCAMDGDPVRRPLLHQTIYRAAALDPTQWTLFDEDRSPQRADGRDEGQWEEVEDVRAAVRFFRLAGDHGGRYARAALVAYLNDDVIPRLHVHQSDHTRRRLLTLTSHLVHELAQMYVDDIMDGVAQRYYRAAFRLAAEAGERLVGAVLLGGISSQALDLGHPHAALRLSEVAVRSVPAAAPPSVHAMALSHLARAQARIGDRVRARASLSAAERHHPLSATADHAVPHVPYACSAGFLAGQKGRTLAALGDHAAALRTLSLSVRQHPATAYLPRALTHAEIARLLLREGRLEDACATWHRFLDDYAQLRSGRADRAVAELRGLLSAHTHRGSVHALLHRVLLTTQRPR